MSDDLYTECCDDAQQLLDMALNKLYTAESILSNQPTVVRLSAASVRDLQEDIKMIRKSIDHLPCLPVEYKKEQPHEG